MNAIKKITLLLFSCLFFLNIPMSGRNGGAIAGGVLGGLALGSVIAASSQPRYYDGPPPSYDYRRQYEGDRRSYDEGYEQAKRDRKKKELLKENKELKEEDREANQ